MPWSGKREPTSDFPAASSTVEENVRFSPTGPKASPHRVVDQALLDINQVPTQDEDRKVHVLAGEDAPLQGGIDPDPGKLKQVTRSNRDKDHVGLVDAISSSEAMIVRPILSQDVAEGSQLIPPGTDTVLGGNSTVVEVEPVIRSGVG